MSPLSKRILVCLLVFASLTRAAAAQTTLSYADLVQRLTDLSHLAVLPLPGERCAQWSSYQRTSQYDPATGKYANWSANGDGQGIIRTEGDLSVLAEMDGPGCIWRIWSARAEQGRVKIYLDGAQTPVVDMPFCDYFDGQHAPFNYPALSYNLKDQGSRGQNLYLPIPYQKSCKIVAEKGWGAYYHFTYGTFPAGTQVPTFTAKLADCEALRKTNTFLADRLGTDPAGSRPGQETLSTIVRVRPGQMSPVVTLPGPQAITAIRVNASFADRDNEMAALRQLAIRITWDDDSSPDVWCPLGDLFGTAPGRTTTTPCPRS